MAGQQRSMEGRGEQKQAAAREAREHGKFPSKVRATTGEADPGRDERDAPFE